MYVAPLCLTRLEKWYLRDFLAHGNGWETTRTDLTYRLFSRLLAATIAIIELRDKLFLMLP